MQNAADCQLKRYSRGAAERLGQIQSGDAGHRQIRRYDGAATRI
jgi:hypothetical protein